MAGYGPGKGFSPEDLPGAEAASGAGPGQKQSYKRERPWRELQYQALEKIGFKTGAKVRLSGLKGAAHLNGANGVLQFYAPESDRWNVQIQDGQDKGQTKALKLENIEQVGRPPPPAAAMTTYFGPKLTLAVGDEVRLSGLESRPGLNGQTGMLVENKGKRWHVRLAHGDDLLLKGRHLDKIVKEDAPPPWLPAGVTPVSAVPEPVPAAEPSGPQWEPVTAPPARGPGSQWEPVTAAPVSRGPAQWEKPPKAPAAEGRVPWFIAGSWTSWKPREMNWDFERNCYQYNVTLGSQYDRQGYESFLLLADGDWTQCLHPDRPSACPHMGYTLCGPNDEADRQKSWTIGQHPLDKATAGARYEVQLFLNDDYSVSNVDWTKLLLPTGLPQAEAPKPQPSKPLPQLKEVLKTAFEALKASGGYLWEPAQRWEVVGGQDRGGILVREGEDVGSKQAPSRLSTGALIKEIELKGERLHYERVTGEGPTTGWVSIKLKDKDLVTKTSKDTKPELRDADLSNLQARLAKVKITTVPELSEALKAKGKDRLSERLRPTGKTALAPDALRKLREVCDAVERLLVGEGALRAQGPPAPSRAVEEAPVLPDPQLPPQPFEVVHEFAMVRRQPTTTAAPLGKKMRGEVLVGLEETFDGFVRLQGDAGWVLKDMNGKLGVGLLLKPKTEPKLASPGTTETGGPQKFEVTYKTVAVRDVPSTNGKTISARKMGDIVSADMQTYHGWIRLTDSAGWMLSAHPELGQLLRPLFQTVKTSTAEEDGGWDGVAKMVQQEVASRKGQAPPTGAPAPEDDDSEVEDVPDDADIQRAEHEAAQRRQAQEAERRRASAAAEEEQKKKAQLAAAAAAAAEKEKQEIALKMKQQQEEIDKMKREREEALRLDAERKEREKEEARILAEETRKREEEEAARQKASNAKSHGEHLEKIRQAVESGDGGALKDARDAAKKAGVPMKEIARVFAMAQEAKQAA